MTRYDREPMSPLRRRYIDDLRLRNKSHRRPSSRPRRQVNARSHLPAEPGLRIETP